MWIFQKPYDMIKGFITPKWLKTLLAEIQGVIIAMAFNIGKEYLAGLEAKITEAENMDWTSEAKFDYVFKWAKANIPNLKDATANLAIEILLALLKKNSFSKVV